ncbi:MAG TPA: molybdopterin oxidoreductase family protein [Acidimicrobiales bacterium]|nr:molybdopterin oxidoreductase family protein [Acidimicrobiales bacterium]
MGQYAAMAQDSSKGSSTTVRGACHHDCPDTCVWDTTVEDGRILSLRGASDHPTTAGELCPKVNRLVDRVYDPARLLRPLRRVGPKGSADFVPISWEEAIAETSQRLTRIIEGPGPEAILPYSFAGTQGAIQMGVMASRFFATVGSSQIHRHICGVTAWLGAADVLGTPYGIDPEDLRHSRTIILWGTNTRLTNRHLWPVITEAREAGATIVVVDPVATATARAPEVDRFVQIRPGTDVALVMAMIQVLDRESLTDGEWLSAHTTGWEELRSSAGEMPPERAEMITGVPADTIEWLARTFATRRPAAIRTLIGAEHHLHGRELLRAVTMLPAVTGAWRDRGGGLARSTSVYFDEALNHDPPVEAPRVFNMASLGRVLCDENLAPPISALIVHNSNPAVTCPDQNAVIAGLTREDLFTVVIEQFMTDTARYADIVLPATTQLEHLDLVPAWGHMYLALNRPAVEPLGESLPNTEIFRRLASAMGFTDPALAESDEELVRGLLNSRHRILEGITWERLSDNGWARLNTDGPPPERPAMRLSALQYAGEATGPDRAVDSDPTSPLRLLSPKTHVRFLNAQYGGSKAHLPERSDPGVRLNPRDAADRGIVGGESVEVFNDRGVLTLTAELSADVLPGVVIVPFGWWNSHTPQQRSVNALTNPEAPGGLGSAAFFDTWVGVRRATSRPNPHL